MNNTLPPLPDHPEPRMTTWSEAERQAIKEYGEECARAALAESAQSLPDGWKLVPVEPTDEMLRAMSSSKATDDEGEFTSLFDLIDYSGENKTRAVMLAAYREMLAASPAHPVQPATDDRITECARRLVEHADFAFGGCLSASSKVRDIPFNAWSQVKTRHLAALRDALAASQENENEQHYPSLSAHA